MGKQFWNGIKYVDWGVDLCKISAIVSHFTSIIYLNIFLNSFCTEILNRFAPPLLFEGGSRISIYNS